jgi:tetratricopeptide (TPR) repeat protein
MQKTTSNILSVFLTELTSFNLGNLKHAGLYQNLGSRIVQLADHALELRQTENVQVLGEILANMPGNFEYVGQYYKAMCLKRVGLTTQARPLFEQVAQSPLTPLSYRARSLHAIGATYYESGVPLEALRYYSDAGRVGLYANDLFSMTQSQWMVAVLKSVDGDHKTALGELERLLPCVRLIATAHPAYFYIYSNSLAVERVQVGQVEEARYASRIALASSYANAYPEWRETGDDIERKGYRASRSFVPITQGLQHNIIRLPEREKISVSQGEPARILHYDWKNRMVKEPNGDQTDDTSLDEMTNKDLIIEIVQRTSNKDMSEKKLRKILEYVMEVESEPED